MRTTLCLLCLLSSALAAPEPPPATGEAPCETLECWDQGKRRALKGLKPEAATEQAQPVAQPTSQPATQPVIQPTPKAISAHARSRKNGQVQLEGVQLKGDGVSVVEEAMRKKLKRLKRHVELKYREHLKAHPGEEGGRMRFTFRVTPVGAPIGLTIQESTLKAPALERVITRTLEEAVYPLAKAGTVIVELSFILTP